MRNCFGIEAWPMFQRDPVSYVYVEARVTLKAQDTPIPLETLKSKYLRR